MESSVIWHPWWTVLQAFLGAWLSWVTWWQLWTMVRTSTSSQRASACPVLLQQDLGLKAEGASCVRATPSATSLPGVLGQLWWGFWPARSNKPPRALPMLPQPGIPTSYTSVWLWVPLRAHAAASWCHMCMSCPDLLPSRCWLPPCPTPTTRHGLQRHVSYSLHTGVYEHTGGQSALDQRPSYQLL